MNVAFFILLGIFLILILPLKFNVDLNLNVLKNRGFIKLKLFSIKFLYYKLKYKEKKIVLSNVKTTKEISLEINKQNIDFMNELQTQLVKRVYLKNLKVYLFKSLLTFSAAASTAVFPDSYESAPCM